MVARTKAAAKAKGKIRTSFAKAKGRSLPKSSGSVAPSSGLSGQGKILKDGGDVYDIDTNVVDAAKNMSKFYRMQVVESNDKSKYWFVQHWGRIGTSGQTQVKGPSSKDTAIKLMQQKFRAKSGKPWAQRGQAGPGTGDSSARAGKGTYELTARLKSAGAKFAKQKGAIAISLMWNHDTAAKRNDLDLHVTPPSGEKVWFRHKKSKCGGELDVDMRKDAKKPVENIVWTKKAPKGMYKVAVQNYSASHNGTMPFTVGIVIDGGEMQLYTKTMPAGNKTISIKKFKY
jgi:predicted DNA-binding WGR domain protein